MVTWARSRRFGAMLALLVSLPSWCGCWRASFEVAVARLQSLDSETRQAAADDLRDGGPIPAAVPHLLAAAQREMDRDVYGAIMIAVGAAGVARARPLIEPCLSAKDPYLRRWAERALDRWLVTNGVLGEWEGLPDVAHPYFDWPEHLSLAADAPGAKPIDDKAWEAATRQHVMRRFCPPR